MGIPEFQSEQLADFRDFLTCELARRQRVNPRYSLRAFARQLQVQSSFLSKVLRGERPITPTFIGRVSEHLPLSERAVAEYKANATLAPRKSEGGPAQFKLLPFDVFATISNWYHYALLELTQLKQFRYDIDWMANELGITIPMVVTAIARLKRIGLLVETDDGTLKCVGNFSNAVDRQLITGAQQALQKDMLRMGVDAMETVPPEERDQSSITVACDSKMLPEIKEKIRVFRRELGAHISASSNSADRVYHLTVGFYPVSGRKRSKEST